MAPAKTSDPLLSTLSQTLVRQYMSAFDMLGNALAACPTRLWNARVWAAEGSDPDVATFWYLGVHTLFWTDVYMFGDSKNFSPPKPFGTEEFQADFVMPARVNDLGELQAYLAHCRKATIARLGQLDAASAMATSKFRWLPCSRLEMYVYNLRHIQEHTSQMSVFLGQCAGIDAPWVQLSKR